MTETLVALLFAHMLADFTLQSDAMVKNKAQLRYFSLHIAIVAATAWAALGLTTALVPILIVAATHFAIDWLKLRFGGTGFIGFIADQAGHVAMILVVAALFPEAWAQGLWVRAAAAAPILAQLPAALAIGAGLIAAVWAGGHAVRALMSGLDFPTDPDAAASLPQGGRLIGRLERLMILMLVLAGETGAIGLLIAAKSVLRFNELARDQDRRVSEYVIIGTLASFSWALAVAFATRAALAALGGP